MASSKVVPISEARRQLSAGQRRWRSAVLRAHKLGLRQADIAALLGVSERTLRDRWQGRGLRVLDDVERLETLPAAGSPATQGAERQAPGGALQVPPGQPASTRRAA